MGFEPTTLCDLVGCSNHWATGDSMVSRGQIVGIDWNRIALLHSHVLTHMNSLTASRCHIKGSSTYELTNSITLQNSSFPFQKKHYFSCR